MFEIHEPKTYYKSSEHMNELKDNSIQLIITSPPYGKIKDYGSKDQIGYYDSFEEYFYRLKQVWKECYRVLEPKCRMIINIGDQYLRTSKFGRYHILSISSQIITDCLSLGFDFLGDIIWQKISTTNTTGGCSLMGSIYYPRNGLLTFDYEHILIFKKYEGKGRKIDLKTRELSKLSLNEWKKWYVGHWRFPGVIQNEHSAMFPEELPYRLIRMFSFIGDTILDPFVGSGTTLKVAKSLFRKGIGYELNENFRKIIENRIKEAKIDHFNDYQFLIYQIFQKAKNEKITISYDKQKQKGIIILEDFEKNEIILDYILLDIEKYNETLISNEVKSKLEENSVQNYLKEKAGWSHYKNYVIVVNSSFSNRQEFMDLIRKYLKNYKPPKPLEFISFELINSKKFQLSKLFINRDIKSININFVRNE